jgi:putative peptide zinc metalloprotease protein
LQRSLGIARHIVEWRVMWRGADAALSALYRWGGHLLFTRLGQILLGAFSLCGIAAFALAWERIAPVLQDAEQSVLLPVFVIAGAYATMLPHEIGHGLTTKHYQRKINGAGVG